MKDFVLRLTTAFILVATSVSAYYFLSRELFTLFLGVLSAYVVVVEWPRFRKWWLTPWYPVMPLCATIHLYTHSPQLWAWLVLVVASYDTAAYIGGNLCGMHKIAPTISSGKSWQGLLCGLISAALMGIIAGQLLLKTDSYGTVYLCLIAFCAALIAFFGDLGESYLKRRAQLKDSGNILPGHGGVLDRIDGLIIAALVFDTVLIFWG